MFQNKKRNIIGKIVEENLDYLFRFAYYQMRNREDAEDIVYEAVLKFLEKKPEEIKPENMRSYLFKIVCNMCIDKKRSLDYYRISINDIDVEEEDMEVSEKLEFERIDSYLKNIEPREADVISMKIMGDLSFVEIGKILSIPQSTVKSRYKAGMDKLRKLFTRKRES